jgi:hypothetical protein
VLSRLAWIAALCVFGTGSHAVAADTKNGFPLAPASIPAGEIVAGGPPRDGIPALVDPLRIPAEEAHWEAEEPVVGVVIRGNAAAYPLSILEWHELVNDTLGGEPILVSYCPLCATAMVFERRIGGRTRSLGVSGLLYRSDLLFYDRETASLWSQIRAEAVTGPSLGERLLLLRARTLLWREWRELHPDSTVLSPETGHRRPYGRSAYGDYATSEELRFPAPIDRRHHPKMPTLGLRLAAGPARAYPAVELLRAGGAVTERFAGREVRVAYDLARESFSVEAPPEVEVVEGYWFAWMAFHPESSVFTARSGAGAAGSDGPRAPPTRRAPRSSPPCATAPGRRGRARHVGVRDLRRVTVAPHDEAHGAGLAARSAHGGHELANLREGHRARRVAGAPYDRLRVRGVETEARVVRLARVGDRRVPELEGVVREDVGRRGGAGQHDGGGARGAHAQPDPGAGARRRLGVAPLRRATPRAARPGRGRSPPSRGRWRARRPTAASWGAW